VSGSLATGQIAARRARPTVKSRGQFDSDLAIRNHLRNTGIRKRRAAPLLRPPPERAIAAWLATVAIFQTVSVTAHAASARVPCDLGVNPPTATFTFACPKRASVSQTQGRPRRRPRPLRRSTGWSARCLPTLLRSSRPDAQTVTAAWQKAVPKLGLAPAHDTQSCSYPWSGRAASVYSGSIARAAERALKGFPINVQGGKRLYSSSQGDRRAS
jgi:hypothetical protein